MPPLKHSTSEKSTFPINKSYKTTIDENTESGSFVSQKTHPFPCLALPQKPTALHHHPHLTTQKRNLPPPNANENVSKKDSIKNQQHCTS